MSAGVENVIVAMIFFFLFEGVKMANKWVNWIPRALKSASSQYDLVSLYTFSDSLHGVGISLTSVDYIISAVQLIISSHNSIAAVRNSKKTQSSRKKF